jgi:hypothetical protein
MEKDLYIIQSNDNGAFKVGVSKNPIKRLSQLQTGSPFKLKIILILEGKSRLEKRLHDQLRSFRLGNFKGEWFSYDGFASLPDWIYEKLDLEEIDNWWR